MSRYAVMVARHKNGIANSFYGEMSGLAREMETENYRLHAKLKMAYCKAVGSNTTHGLDCCDNYREWIASLSPNQLRGAAPARR